MAAQTVILRSFSDGRERWEVNTLRGESLLCRQMEELFNGIEGVYRSLVNPLTGRILLEFEPSVFTLNRKNLIRAALAVASSSDGQRQNRGAGGLFARARAKILATLISAGGKNTQELVDLIKSVESEEDRGLKPVALSMLSSTLKLAGPINLGFIMAAGVTGGLPILATIGLSSPMMQIVFLSGTYFSLLGLYSAAEYHRKNAWDDYSKSIGKTLRKQALEHVHGMDMAYLDKLGSTELMGMINDDSEKIQRFLCEVPHSAIERTLTFAVGTTVMMFVAPLAFVAAMVPVPIVYYITKRGRGRVAGIFTQLAVKENEFNAVVFDNINGLQTVRGFTAEQRELERLERIGREHLSANRQVVAASNSLTGVAQGTLSAGTAVALIYGSTAVLTGSITFTSLTALSSVLPPMIMSTQGVHKEVELYQNAVAATGHILKMRAIEPGIVGGVRRVSGDSGIRGDIVFKKVSFGYDGVNRMLKEIDIAIPAHQTTAFVGPTGSGKTTLIKLLQRFYDAQGGKILLDGEDIREFDLVDLRHLISVISQDVYLFHASVYDNILYGRPDASYEEVENAAKVAHAYEFVQALPGKFNAIIGERGKTLSGGQRQRISIARAILKNSPILVLDEATSAVDNKTESLLQASVAEVSTNKTTIVIAHRLSTVRNADRIYMIKHGRVEEFGTHDELVNKNGSYSELWRLQTQQQEAVC